jgi:hypothetical protein
MSRRVHRASDDCLATALVLLHEMARHLTDDRLKAVATPDGKARLSNLDVPFRLDWSLVAGPLHVTLGDALQKRILQIREWRPASVDASRAETADVVANLITHLSASTLIRYDPFELAPVVADVATRVDADGYLVTLPTPWGGTARIRRRDAEGRKWSANLRRSDPDVMVLLPVSVSCSVSKDTAVVSIFPTEVEATAPGPVDLLRGLEALSHLRNAA